MDAHRHLDETEAAEVTGQVDGVLDYTITFRPTIDHGVEVVVALVNEVECVMRVGAVRVRHALDGRDRGEHEVYFHDADRHGWLELDQYAIAEGHYHILDDVSRFQRLEATVVLDYELLGDRSHAELTRRVTTRVFRR